MIDDRQRIVEWSYAAAMMLGVRIGDALGRPCYEVLQGNDSFGKAICRPNCPALKALRNGDLTASCSFLLSSQEDSRKRVLADLVALPGESGGAIAILTERRQESATSRANNQAAPLPAVGNKTGNLVRDLAALTALATSLSPDSLEQSIQHSLGWLTQATNMESAELFLVEPQGEDMLLTAYRGPFKNAFSQITRFRPGDGFPGLVQRRGESIVTTRLAEDPRYLRGQVRNRGYHSYVCVPILASGKVIGALNVATRRPAANLERAVRLLTWASHPIGTALQAGLLQAREAVGATSSEVPTDSERDFDGLLRALLRRMMLIGNATGGALTVYDWKARGVARRVKEGDFSRVACPDMKAQDSHLCPAMVSGRGTALYGRRNSWPPPCQHMEAKGAVVYCLPLVTEGEKIGMVQLRYADPVPSPATGYLAVLLNAAERAAPTIRQAWTSTRDQERSLRLQSALLRDGSRETPRGQSSLEKPPQGVDNGDTSASRPFLDVRCFGGLELYRQGRLLTPEMFQRRGALTLLKVLLIQGGRPVSRDALIETLWPEVDPLSGANRLYVLIHTLRRMIEPDPPGRPWVYICNDGDRYYLNPRAPYRLDIEEFRECVSLGERLEREGDVALAMDAYEAAVNLYKGDLLEDEVYAEWCWGEREHLKETCLAILRRLATFYLEQHALEKSIESYRKALRIDVLREESHRGLMHVLWLVGRRDEALRQYQACRDILRRDLGVDPLPETEDIYSLIRGNGER